MKNIKINENIKSKNKNAGNTIYIAPIVLVVSMMFLVVIGTYLITLITPFIWYEKLNTLSQKYMFVIEKYGYLTGEEKTNLQNDLKEDGFDVENIDIIAPSTKQNYGELILFKLEYRLIQNNPVILNGVLKGKKNEINIKVKKYSYSKI